MIGEEGGDGVVIFREIKAEFIVHTEENLRSSDCIICLKEEAERWGR